MKTQAVFLRVLYRSTNPNQPKHDPDQVGTSTIVGTPAINSVRHSSNFFCQFVSMSIQPVAIVDLDHRAYKICGIGNPFGLIVVSPSGQFTLINDRFEHRPALLPANIGSARTLEIDSAIESIAVVHLGSANTDLAVRSTNGKQVCLNLRATNKPGDDLRGV